MTAQDHADATRTLRGITFMATTVLIFSLMDAMAKYLSADYPTIFILWVRYVFQFPDQWTIVGATVIIASGLYVIRRETVRRRERQQDA